MSTNQVNSQPRDKGGRFASKSSVSTSSSKRTAKTPAVTNVKSNPKSSFIKSMFESGGLVHVTMNRNPKTMYSYKPTASGLKAVKDAITKGSGLGEAYNQHLKNREISRTLYK